MISVPGTFGAGCGLPRNDIFGLISHIWAQTTIAVLPECRLVPEREGHPVCRLTSARLFRFACSTPRRGDGARSWSPGFSPMLLGSKAVGATPGGVTAANNGLGRRVSARYFLNLTPLRAGTHMLRRPRTHRARLRGHLALHRTLSTRGCAAEYAAPRSWTSQNPKPLAQALALWEKTWDRRRRWTH